MVTIDTVEEADIAELAQLEVLLSKGGGGG